MKKILSLGLISLTFLTTMSSNVFAAGNITTIERNLTPDKVIISTYEPVTRSPKSNVTYDHSAKIIFDAEGSASYKEKISAKTYHNIKNGTKLEPVDGYTRARWERGSKILGDSGRCWDNADGEIDGYSTATSGWIVENITYVAHSYYGS